MLLPVLVERAPGDVFSSSCVVEYDLLLLITAYDLDPDNSTTGPLGKWPVFSSSSSVNILFVILRGKFELNYLFRWLDFTPKTLPHLVQEKKKITLSPLRLPFFYFHQVGLLLCWVLLSCCWCWLTSGTRLAALRPARARGKYFFWDGEKPHAPPFSTASF